MSRRKMSGSSQPTLSYRVPDPDGFRQALERFRLSSGETLLQASQSRLLAMVFLRHFGCTFTRQILRGLEHLEKQALSRNAELVMVHMLQDGGESNYLGERNLHVSRVADPHCQLYRAFGLGRGSLFELFGPRVWWLGMLSVFKGCGVGRFAGDGLQMPGVFLLHDGEIIAGSPAKSASDLPNLPALFAAVPRSSLNSSLESSR